MINRLFTYPKLVGSLVYGGLTYQLLALRSPSSHVVPGESLRLVLHNMH